MAGCQRRHIPTLAGRLWYQNKIITANIDRKQNKTKLWRSLLLFETFLYYIPREIQRVLSKMHLHVNRKAHVACNFHHLFKNKRLLFLLQVFNCDFCTVMQQFTICRWHSASRGPSAIAELLVQPHEVRLFVLSVGLFVPIMMFVKMA